MKMQISATSLLATIIATGALFTLSSGFPQGFPPANLGVLDASGAIPFWIQDGKDVPGFLPSDRQLAIWALDAWAKESGRKLKFVEAKTPDSGLLRLRWVSAREGLFGETQHTKVGSKDGALVFVMPDVTQLGEPLAARAARDRLLRDTIVYLTCVHELGHALGLPHTRDFEDIMYSFGYGGDIVDYFMRYREKLKSRDDIMGFSGVSAADTAALRRLYP